MVETLKETKTKEKKDKVLPGFEPGTFCVLGRCDNHYTTAPTWSAASFPIMWLLAMSKILISANK